MGIIIRRATENEYGRVRAFYYDIIDEMADMEYHPMWQKGIYPEDESLKASVEAGEMYIAEDGENIVGAMVVNTSYNDGYRGIKWPSGASESEAAVIHLLGVMPSLSRKGLGSRMVRYAADISQKMGRRVIRLDVLEGNLPAHRLYLRCGFAEVKTLPMYYEDTGWKDFTLYEYEIK